MTVTIQNAQIYSLKCGAEVAHQITYSDGTEVRCVESANNIIRKEWKSPKGWVTVGKPYVVVKSRVRAAEQIKAAVIEWLKA